MPRSFLTPQFILQPQPSQSNQQSILKLKQELEDMDPTPPQLPAKHAYPDSAIGIREEVSRRVHEFAARLQELEKKTGYKVHHLTGLKRDGAFQAHFSNNGSLRRDWEEQARLFDDFNSIKKDIQQAGRKNNCLVRDDTGTAPRTGAALVENNMNRPRAIAAQAAGADSSQPARRISEQHGQVHAPPVPFQTDNTSTPAPPVAMAPQDERGQRKDVAEKEGDEGLVLVKSDLVQQAQKRQLPHQGDMGRATKRRTRRS